MNFKTVVLLGIGGIVVFLLFRDKEKPRNRDQSKSTKMLMPSESKKTTVKSIAKNRVRTLKEKRITVLESQVGVKNIALKSRGATQKLTVKVEFIEGKGCVHGDFEIIKSYMDARKKNQVYLTIEDAFGSGTSQGKILKREDFARKETLNFNFRFKNQKRGWTPRALYICSRSKNCSDIRSQNLNREISKNDYKLMTEMLFYFQGFIQSRKSLKLLNNHKQSRQDGRVLKDLFERIDLSADINKTVGFYLSQMRNIYSRPVRVNGSTMILEIPFQADYCHRKKKRK